MVHNSKSLKKGLEEYIERNISITSTRKEKGGALLFRGRGLPGTTYLGWGIIGNVYFHHALFVILKLVSVEYGVI